LDALGALEPGHVEALLAHEAAAVRVHALAACDRWLKERPALVEKILELARDSRVEVRLQAALTLGDVLDDRAVPALAELALEPSADPWLQQAVLTSVAGRGDRLLAELLWTPARITRLSQTKPFLDTLAAAIAARRDPAELSSTLVRIAAVSDVELQRVCLSGLLRELENVSDRLPLDDAARQAVNSFAASRNEQVRRAGAALTVSLQLESDAQRHARLSLAVTDLNDLESTLERRLEAVSELALDRDAHAAEALVAAFGGATPAVRETILDALFARQDRLPIVLAAIESRVLPKAVLGAVERRALLEHADPGIRERAGQLLDAGTGPNEETFKRLGAALQLTGDAARGEKLFREKCAVCHRAHGIGTEVGPDVTSEAQRRPETILRDILAPSDVIAAGYASYLVETVFGQVIVGVLAEESANSFTFRLEDGNDRVVLRKDIERLQATTISLMPENLADSLQPQDVSDVIAWLSRGAK
jgi:putative heme-binding domain-containing protein